jgi:pimeloyl-ACP methyl ester carboxylesterase
VDNGHHLDWNIGTGLFRRDMEISEPMSRFVRAPDGLRLHTRIYGRSNPSALPVVCLAGLTRTCADFDVLARRLSNGKKPRITAAIDSRGRGRSDFDGAGSYNLAVELADVFTILTALEIPRAIFIGTSRGGILTMMAAAAKPDAIAGAVLNDIGPAIDTKGLLRIKSYVGRFPQPRSFEEAAEFLRRLFGAQFPKLTTEDWIGFARRSFAEKDRKLVATYDERIAKTLEGIDPDQPIPPLWKEFDALGNVPVMVIRGANSDVLSSVTVEAMAARRPDLDILEVADQGHPPLLAEDEVLGRIEAFVCRCDKGVNSE